MTQEERELLLKDLCGRLPYGVMITDGERTRMLDYLVMVDVAVEKGYRPYLRPMESMTKEERHNFFKASKYASMNDDNTLNHCSPDGYDWLNANYFDYRGLIPIGLALPAKEGMYDK